MTYVALTPAEIDLTLKKLSLTPPKKIGVKGSMTPKFQSLNRALHIARAMGLPSPNPPP